MTLWSSSTSPALFRARAQAQPLVALCAVVAAARAVAQWVTLGPELQPDTGYYVAGLGLFPSPLGTLVGTLGVGGLAVLNLAGAVGLVLVAAALAGWTGRAADLAALAAVVVPASFWTVHATTDSLAALCVACAVLVYRSWNAYHSPWWPLPVSMLLCVVAVGLHLAALPVVLALLLGARRAVLLPLGVVALAAGVCVAAATPYEAVLRPPSLAALAVGLVGALSGLWFLLPAQLVAFDGALALGLLGAAVAGAMVAAVGHDAGSRYVLPLVPLAAASAGRALVIGGAAVGRVAPRFTRPRPNQAKGETL